jgi:Uma2 family endonuclease
MAALAETLTLEEFQSKYGSGDRAYEFWYGEAITKATPTWIHCILQGIIIQLLKQAGYKAAGPELELRIVPEAHPRPDVVATKRKIKDPYPLEAVEVVVEILSPDDKMPYLLEKCQKYHTWGFEYIYIVNPESRQLFRWTGAALEVSDKLTSLPAARIWQELDEALDEPKS